MHFAGRQERVIMPNGSIVPLKQYELVRKVRSSRIFTIQALRSVNYLTIYEISDNQLVERATRQVNCSECGVWQERTGNFIVTDAVEGYGTFVEIYGENFELLNRYEPDGGIGDVLTSSYGSVVVVVSQGSTETSIIVFDSKKGTILNSGKIDSNTIVQNLVVGKSSFLICRPSKIECYNFFGQKIWEKGNTVLRSLELQSDQVSYYFIEGSNLVGINQQTGVTTFIKKGQDLFANQTDKSDFRLVAFEVLSNSSPVFILQNKTTARAVLFSPAERENLIELPSYQASGLAIQPGKFLITTNNELLKYEE